MKLIAKNILRSLLRNKVQAIAVVLLLMFSGYFFSLMLHTLLPMSSMYDQAKTTTNAEQFRFAPLPGATDGQLDATADGNRFSYQKYRSKNITEPETFLIATDYRGDIDQATFTEGTGPTADNTLAISLGYARENNTHPGDSISIQGTPYTISGIFYDLADNRVADPAAPKAHNAKILATEDAYLRLNGAETTTYLGVFNDRPDNAEAEIQRLAESGQLLYITPSSAIPSTSYLAPMLNTQTSVTYATIALILVVSSIFTSMFINTHIRNSRAHYGTALAMGYRKRDLILPYACMSVLFMVVTLIGAIAGFLGKNAAIERMANINFPLGHSTLQVFPLICFTLIVTLLLGTFTLSQVWKNLRIPPLDLIIGARRQRSPRIVALLHGAIARLPFKQHIKYAMALSRISRIALMIPAIAISTTLICWALSMNSAFSASVKNLETKTSYQDIVTYAGTSTTPPGEYGEKFLRGSGFLSTISIKDGTDNNAVNKPVTLEFLDLKHAPFSFATAPGPDAAPEGAVIPVRYQYLNGAAIGDTVTIKTKNSVLTQKISGFNDLPGENFYLSNTLLPRYDDTLTTASYNGEYLLPGAEKPEHYKNLTSKQDIISRATENQQNNSLTVTLILLFCIFSAFAIVSTISKNNATDNAAAMTILLMSGYRKKTVSSLLLNIYGSTLIIGTALAASLLPPVLHQLAIAFSTSDGSFLQLQFSWTEFGTACVLVLLSYFLSLTFGTRKYLKMDLRKVLN